MIHVMEIWYMWSLLSLLSSLNCFWILSSWSSLAWKICINNHDNTIIIINENWLAKTQNVLLSPFWRPPLQSKGQICIRLIMDSDLRSGGAAWNSSLNTQAKPSHMGEKANKRKGPRHYWETPPTAEENNGWLSGFTGIVARIEQACVW